MARLVDGKLREAAIRIRFLTVLSVVFIFIGGMGQAMAQDDGCGSLGGEAKGLCTAYCEAMDCDASRPMASQTACKEVAKQFENLTGTRLPCVCPCFETAFLTDVPTWDLDTIRCVTQGGGLTLFDGGSTAQTLVDDVLSCSAGLFVNGDIIDIFPTEITPVEFATCNNKISGAAGILVPESRDQCNLP